jgi:hypothetical protein
MREKKKKFYPQILGVTRGHRLAGPAVHSFAACAQWVFSHRRLGRSLLSTPRARYLTGVWDQDPATVPLPDREIQRPLLQRPVLRWGSITLDPPINWGYDDLLTLPCATIAPTPGLATEIVGGGSGSLARRTTDGGNRNHDESG